METHELPETLNPAGDKCYPLFIPDDPHWKSLILGAIANLTLPEYYRQNAFAEQDVNSVIENWNNRTLEPLVQALSDDNGCGISTMTATYQSIERTSTQVIPANVVTNIIFPNVTALGTNVYVLDDGIATINARLACFSGNAQIQLAILLLNDIEIARDDNRSTSSQQYFEMTAIHEVDSGDEIKLQVYALGGTTVQIVPFTPQVRMVINAT